VSAAADLRRSVESRGEAALFICGFVLLGAELLLARAGALIIGADAGGLGWTLGSFLLGSAIGGLIAGSGRGTPRFWCLASLGTFALGALILELLPSLLLEADLGRTSVRFLGSLCVLIPALPFGALPIAWYGVGSPDLQGTRQRVGRWLSANDLGSALGALALPALLLPLLGPRWTAGFLLASLALLHSMARNAPREVSSPVAPSAPRAGSSSRGALLLAAAVGAGTLAHQLVVTRLLGELLGASLLVLGSATAATLIGAAAAARAAPRLLDRWGADGPLVGAGSLWLLMQGAASLTIPSLPSFLLARLGSFPPEAILAPTLWKLAAVAVVVVPVGLGAGAILPLLLARGSEDAPGLRRLAGPLEAAWLIGGALGAWGGGVVILSRFGSEVALRGVAAATALGLVLWTLRSGVGRSRLILIPLLLLAGGAFFESGRRWDPALLGVGIYAWDRGSIAAGEALEGWREREVTYLGEGRIAKVAIEVAPRQNAAYLRVGGRIEGSVAIDPELPTFADLPTEVLLGLLPSVEGPGEGSLLAIGLGGGTTVATAVENWRGEVTALELEPEVAAALRSPAGRKAFPRESRVLFPEGGGGPRILFEDARSYLARTSQGWDAIVCQPSEPWLPWSAPLFTEAFYELVRERLRPGGVAIHWIQLYRIAPEEFAAIASAFLQVFPDARCYHPPGTGEVILVGGGETAPAIVDARRNAPETALAWARGAKTPFPTPLISGEAFRAWCAIEGGDRRGNLRARLEHRLPLIGDRGVDRAGEILLGLSRSAAASAPKRP